MRYLKLKDKYVFIKIKRDSEIRYLSQLLALCFSCILSGVCAQDVGDGRFTIPLDSAIHQLENHHNITFAYDPVLLESVQVNLPSHQKNWKSSLQDMLASTDLTYEIIRTRYVMIKKKPRGPTLNSFNAYIVDTESKEPLPFATLQFVKGEQGFQSNEDGMFDFEYANHPDDSVEIRYVGYKPMVTPISRLGKVINLTFNPLHIDDVLVSENSLLPVGYNNQEGYFGLNPKQIQLQAGWGEPDILRMVQMLPGISSPNEGASAVHIRGGTPDQNLVLWNGIPVYHSGHFFGMFGAFNPYIIDEVKIFKGGYDASYGGRASGVIDINTQETPYEEARFGLGFNLINWHAYAKVPLFKKRFSITFSSRSSIIDGWRNNTYNNIFNKLFQIGKIADYRNIEQQDLLNKNLSNFSYAETNARIQWHWKKGDGLSLSFFDSSDDFKYIFEVDQPWVTHATTDQFTTSNQGVHIEMRKHLFPIWRTYLSFVASNFNHNFRTKYTGDLGVDYHIQGILDNSLDNASIRWSNQVSLTDRHTLHVGYELNNWEVGLGFEYDRVWEEDKIDFQYNIENTVHTTYFNYEYTIPETFFLRAGLRHNAVYDEQVSYWEPRLSMNYIIPDRHIRLKFATGRYAQYISQIIQDNDLGVGDQLWATAGIENIPVVISNDVMVGIGYQHNGLLLDIEAYSKNTKGLSKLNLDNAMQDFDGFSSGTSEAMGLEILAQKKWKNFRTLVAYNLSKVNYQFRGFNDDQPFPPLHDQPHILRIGNMYSWRNWEFILNFHYLSGRPYSKGDGVLGVYDQSNGETYYFIRYARENAERLDGYHRLDFSVQKKWLIRKTQIVSGISLFNLTNSSNPTARHYYVYYPESKEQPEQNFFTEIGLRRTLNLYFRIEFGL